MKKSAFITIAVALAAAVGGYFLARIANPRGDVSMTYENCSARCNETYNAKLNAINQTYDGCADAAYTQFRTMFLDCPCADPLKPPCVTCHERANERLNRDLGICRATRNTAIAQASLEYADCVKECRKYIFEMQQ